MIAIIDYGMGNLRSVQKALEHVGATAHITQNVRHIQDADKVVLPGVGAMKPAMERLEALNLVPTIKESINSGKPFLGICLGLQLLFESSDEGGQVQGLGVIPGKVVRFERLKIPHMGWNQLNVKNQKCPIFKTLANDEYLYFCH